MRAMFVLTLMVVVALIWASFACGQPPATPPVPLPPSVQVQAPGTQVYVGPDGQYYIRAPYTRVHVGPPPPHMLPPPPPHMLPPPPPPPPRSVNIRGPFLRREYPVEVGPSDRIVVRRWLIAPPFVVGVRREIRP